MTIITMPSYRGSKKFLGSNYAPSGYFEHTEVKKWSLSHFLTSYSTESEFLDGLVLINKNKSVDTCVRGFAWSLHTYYSGAMGYWRQVLCRKIASNNIKRASLTQSHISAALSQEETLTEQLELSVTHHHELPNNDTETDTILGKRARVDDDGNNDETEEDGYVRMNKMHQNPLLSEDDGAVEGEDPVSLAQARSRLAMNIVFELDNFAFTATLDGIDFGKEFTSYYEDCQSLQYDADNLADFVALSGVLMLDERPTHLQKTHLGAKYKQLWDLIGNRAVYPTQEDIDEALKICRDAKDAYMKSPSKRVDATASRTRMEESIEKAPKSTLRSLLLYGSRLHKICTPFSEADQTSQFILGTLSPIMNRPDETRIAQ
ncbi:MAG: hypothetical protein J3Q66DRAFT_86679 [Benniella sp.]|nr:MAG: hypothetical protein J3Q66DRAFT_86679 [Benniella sp.]